MGGAGGEQRAAAPYREAGHQQGKDEEGDRREEGWEGGKSVQGRGVRGRPVVVDREEEEEELTVNR